MKRRKGLRPAFGAEFGLISRRNRVHVDRKKENRRRWCRRKGKAGF